MWELKPATHCTKSEQAAVQHVPGTSPLPRPPLPSNCSEDDRVQDKDQSACSQTENTPRAKLICYQDQQ